MEIRERPGERVGRRMSISTSRRREQRGRPIEPLPRLLLTREESARVLGMSLSHFQRHVQPYVPCVYSGQLRQYRPEDLRRWTERSATEPTGRAVSRA
jgi:AraC-like DNA-binding protein